MKFAVQMYTLRHQIQNGDDMLAILGNVKDLGFDGVEFAGFQGLAAETLKARLDELGLVCAGAHMGLDDMKPEKIEATLDYMQALGAWCVGIGGANTETETALSEVCEIMAKADEAAAKRGMQVYFHNHTGEFRMPLFAEKPGTIFERIRDNCHVQIDTYWSFAAGQDNYKLITENKDRIVTLHLKDGVGDLPMALGEGDNDLAAVIRAAKDAEIEWLVLENDDPTPDGLSDITRSMAWIKENAK